MIYITNLDKPGFIGTFSGTLGEAGINIATFHVGRQAPGGDAVALIEIDGDLPGDVLAKVQALPQVQSAKTLKFDPLPQSSPVPRGGDRVARLERSEMRPG
jgi:D-3-phosphoglycerate dehydrogenase